MGPARNLNAKEAEEIGNSNGKPLLNLFAFWDEHYRVLDDDLRVMIVKAALDMLNAAGWGRRQLEVRKYRHPMTRRKSWAVKFSILDIFADIIMRPAQGTEFRAEYPVKNADAEWYDSKKRSKREISYEAFTDGGGQVDIDRRAYIPKENKEVS